MHQLYGHMQLTNNRQIYEKMPANEFVSNYLFTKMISQPLRTSLSGIGLLTGVNWPVYRFPYLWNR